MGCTMAQRYEKKPNATIGKILYLEGETLYIERNKNMESKLPAPLREPALPMSYH